MMIKADRQRWALMASTNIKKKIDLNVDSSEFMDSLEISCKDNIYPKIKNSSKSSRSRRIAAAKIIHVNNMTHEEENYRPCRDGARNQP
jgi:hypothetical protein